MRTRLLLLTIALLAALPASAGAQSSRYFTDVSVSGLIPDEQPVEPPVRTIRLTVSPKRVRVGQRVTFRFRATSRSRDTVEPPLACERRRARNAPRADARACAASHRIVPVSGAIVRFAGGRGRTDSRGYVRITRTLRSAGLKSARATRSGYRPGTTRVRAVRAVVAGLTG